VLALLPRPSSAEDPLDRETREIASTLRCPVCQNISVADSSSELAGEMRGLIRKKLAAGESRDQIVAYFVERYGTEVLLDPPKSGLSGLVWLGAAFIPLVGLALVWAHLRSRGRQGPSTPDVAGPPITDTDVREYGPLLEREVEQAGGPGL
jgi:cytochrome c-type biogenesis protein CcmH